MGKQTQIGRGGQELSGVVSPGEHDRLFIVAEGVDGQRTSLFGIRKLEAVLEFMFNLWIKR